MNEKLFKEFFGLPWIYCISFLILIVFYEFFDLFDELNSGKCYVICSNKPNFGPYDGPKYSLEVIMF